MHTTKMTPIQIIKEWEKVSESLGSTLKVPLRTMSLKLMIHSESSLGQHMIQGFDLMGSGIMDPSFISTRIVTKLNNKPVKVMLCRATKFRRALSFVFKYGHIVESDYGKYWLKCSSSVIDDFNIALKDELFKYPNLFLESNSKTSSIILSTNKLIKNEKELLELIELNKKLVTRFNQ